MWVEQGESRVSRFTIALPTSGRGRAARERFYAWQQGAGDWLPQIWRDHVHAVRRLSKNPAFTTVVALTLALAIGGNAAIYSVVSGVLLKPLPYPDPDRLVRVFAQHPRFGDVPLTPVDFHALREHKAAFAGAAAFYREGHEFGGSAGPENLEACSSPPASSSCWARVLRSAARSPATTSVRALPTSSS